MSVSTAYNDPTPLTPELFKRFMAKVRVNPETGCWVWMGACNNIGYGNMWVRGRSAVAHRISYCHHVGPIPDGLDLDHLCRVRNCVNPAHLEPVTRRENILRGTGPQVAAEKNWAKTHCTRGHPYSGDNLYFDAKNKKRQCHACRLIAQKKRPQRLVRDLPPEEAERVRARGREWMRAYRAAKREDRGTHA